MPSPFPRSALPYALLVAAACADPTRPGDDVGGSEQGVGFDQAWIGRFAGPGQGLADGSIVTVSDAVLTIMRDADSVRIAECPRCMTVVLDTVFMVANVPPADPQTIEILYQDDDAVRVLRLEKYSGAGSVSNVVLARLAVRSRADRRLLAEITYVLEAR